MNALSGGNALLTVANLGCVDASASLVVHRRFDLARRVIFSANALMAREQMAVAPPLVAAHVIDAIDTLTQYGEPTQSADEHAYTTAIDDMLNSELLVSLRAMVGSTLEDRDSLIDALSDRISELSIDDRASDRSEGEAMSVVDEVLPLYPGTRTTIHGPSHTNEVLIAEIHLPPLSTGETDDRAQTATQTNASDHEEQASSGAPDTTVVDWDLFLDFCRDHIQDLTAAFGNGGNVGGDLGNNSIMAATEWAGNVGNYLNTTSANATPATEGAGNVGNVAGQVSTNDAPVIEAVANAGSNISFSNGMVHVSIAGEVCLIVGNNNNIDATSEVGRHLISLFGRAPSAPVVSAQLEQVARPSSAMPPASVASMQLDSDPSRPDSALDVAVAAIQPIEVAGNFNGTTHVNIEQDSSVAVPTLQSASVQAGVAGPVRNVRNSATRAARASPFAYALSSHGRDSNQLVNAPATTSIPPATLPSNISFAPIGYVLQFFPDGISMRRLLPQLRAYANQLRIGSKEHYDTIRILSAYSGRAATERLINDASVHVDFAVRRAQSINGSFFQLYLKETVRPFYCEPQPPKTWSPVHGLTYVQTVGGSSPA